jgi:hypothetical protein
VTYKDVDSDWKLDLFVSFEALGGGDYEECPSPEM